MVVYKNKLFQAVSGATSSGVFTRYYSSEEGWSEWIANGLTGEDVSMIPFYDRLYQAVRGKTSTDHIFTRYTMDGIEWTDWVRDDQVSTQTPIPRITPNNGGMILSDDETASVVFPGQAVTEELVVTITNHQNISLLDSGNFQLIGEMYDFIAYDASGELVTEFAENVEIIFSYNPNELDGISETSLQIYYYHELSGEWREIPSTVDTTTHQVHGVTDHFTKFAIFAPTTPEPGPNPTVIPGDPTPDPPAGVPEPATMLLFGAGLLLILWRVASGKRRK